MSFEVKKLNNEVVKVIQSKVPKDLRPVRGWKLFPEMNANSFVCAKKKSGKTVTIWHTLRKCCGKDTKIIVFCATLHKDPSWIAIQEWAEEKGLVFIGHESIKDEDGVDQLDLRRQPKEREKYQTPEYIFILDDLSTELKSNSIPREAVFISLCGLRNRSVPSQLQRVD